MPHNHDQTGGLTVGQRITRLEMEVEAHSEHDEVGFARIWAEIDDMKKDSEKKAAELRGEVTAAKDKLTAIQIKVALMVGILSAIGGAALSWAVKHL